MRVNGCELAVGITVLASTFAAQIEDDEDLSVLAAAFTQFGDTLATIAAWRARCAVLAAAREVEKGNGEEKAATEKGEAGATGEAGTGSFSKGAVSAAD